MITREQIEEAFGDNRDAFKTQGIDHNITAITLLRERIPYDVCRSIIGGASHDVIYLSDIEDTIPYISEEDLAVLADCNVWVNKTVDCLALFV